MTNRKTGLVILSFFLLFASLASYIFFLKYQPKALKTLSEVRGVSTMQSDNIPYPVDAVKLGFNQTPDSKQTTFQTAKTLDEVKQFYKNIFTSKDWVLTTDSSTDQTMKQTYQKKNDKASIVGTVQDKNITIVSIEITGSDF